MAGNTVWTYDVGATHGVTAHQVAEVTATGPKAGTVSRVFDYDQAGTTATHTAETGATRTLLWHPEGKLASVTDGQDNRIMAHTPDKSTLYLGTPPPSGLPAGGSPPRAAGRR